MLGGVKNTILAIVQPPSVQLLRPFGYLFKYVLRSLLHLSCPSTPVSPDSGDMDVPTSLSYSHLWCIYFCCLQIYSHVFDNAPLEFCAFLSKASNSHSTSLFCYFHPSFPYISFPIFQLISTCSLAPYVSNTLSHKYLFIGLTIGKLFDFL